MSKMIQNMAQNTLIVHKNSGMVEDTANSFTNSLQSSEKIDFFVKKIIFIFKFLRLQEIKNSCCWIFSEALEQHESGEISAET